MSHIHGQLAYQMANENVVDVDCTRVLRHKLPHPFNSRLSLVKLAFAQKAALETRQGSFAMEFGAFHCKVLASMPPRLHQVSWTASPGLFKMVM